MSKNDVKNQKVGIVLRRAADGSFRVDEKSLYRAPGVKKQAEAARLISEVMKRRRIA